MKCKICEHNSNIIFKKIVLLKYNVNYYKCDNCSFVQTDEPFWFEEAYNTAITSLDIGILIRNNYLTTEISKIIDCCFGEAKRMLDFAGGYGIFVRLMRDKGFDFFRQDIYCENLFAKHFDISDINDTHFDLVTGFEILEHLQNPLKEIEEIFKYSENAIFSTELIPESNDEIENWWYISQETGQHIAFYSPKAMQLIAEKFGKNYYCKNKHIHIFTTKNLDTDQIDYALNDISIKRHFFGLIKKRVKKYRKFRESYQYNDYLFLKKILNS
ncbi:class I SAM-dependent methyltransferase [Flavobacterium sp.]|uniref:class I SAM-dependent methyltransferase n=1 Tax=Flavobacterium sp. TaxID=239 RepID=UPI003750DAF3